MNNLLLVSDALVRALGWALAHSLWQATAAALLLLILMPRLQTARQRYWAAYAALLAVFAAALVTFGWSYEPNQKLEGSVANTLGENANGTFFFIENQPFATSLWQTFSAWLEANHGMLVAVWLLGFGFFLLRLGGGLWQVQRLRTQGVTLPEALWLERFKVIRQRLGFSRAVNLLESTLVQTPMAIGWLKPVVLLPIGLVNRLSVAEVEAVLAHELAHIARRDWIFNLLQAFIESLFYYHPAVWWVSAVVRRERENCCDDAALAATGNPLAFAKALVQVQEMAVPVPVLALGLSGPRRRPLLERVRRILNQPAQQQHQVMEKITATVILLAFLALVGLKANSVPTLEAAFSQITNIPAALFGAQSEGDQMASDSLPKPKNTRKITREDDNQRVEAEYKDGKLTRLNIDGKEIPASEFVQHEALVEDLQGEALTPPPSHGGFWGSERSERAESPEAPEAPEAPERPERPERPELWEIPAAPDAPRGFGFNFLDPNAALTPFPAMRGPVLVFSGKDAAGNAVIRLDNGGESTELVVKGSDVFVNGKKLEKGESLDMPGLRIGSNGAFLFPGGSYAYSSDNEAAAMALKENHRAYEQDMKLATEEMARSQKDWEKEQKRWEKEQKTWEKEQKNWEKEQKKWEKDQAKWQAEQEVWAAKSNAMQDALKKELLKDGLITDPNDFSLQVNEKELKVNKKKQSEALRRKYLELVESMSGQKLDGKGSFHYNNSDDDN